MIKGSIDSIETFGLVDGPGIRTVIFFNGCKLRCKYCHNPEMWKMKELNYTPIELVNKVIRNKPYFRNNNGGVTFSGGEPLLQKDFLIECIKLLKEEDIHIALDTAGVGIGDYDNILENIDLVLLDIKHVDSSEYFNLTGQNMAEFYKFIDALNKQNKEVWIRQVIVPGLHDNSDYIDKLVIFLKQINNITRIDFLPYHKLGSEKYIKLNIINPYLEKEAMDEDKCKKLYKEFMEKYHS